MSNTPRQSRHALGLPAGSIRALLTVAVLGLSWLLVLFVPKATDSGKEVFQVPMIFIYLQFLLVLILAHYFTAEFTPAQEGGPVTMLGLPQGTIRILILIGYGGLIYYLWHQRNDMEYDFKPTGDPILMVGLMFAGFVIGHYFTLLALWWMRPIGEIPAYILDIQAWFAILAMLGLLIVFLVHVVINPGVPPDQRLTTGGFEAGLAAIVGFYFGARS